MAVEKRVHSSFLVIDEPEPLGALITIVDGQEKLVAAGSESDDAARNALGVFGAWSDLDWDAAAEALDRIRHESAPTPPADE